MYNHVTFMGRICNELELKTTPNGTTVLTFRIAVERGYQAKNGDRTTDFFDIIAWKNTVEFIAKYFAKGKMILLDGEMQTREYVDKNGINRKVCELVVSTARFAGDKSALQSQKSSEYSENGLHGENAAGIARVEDDKSASQSQKSDEYDTRKFPF
jgi:single-strand DNA-binding protein